MQISFGTKTLSGTSEVLKTATSQAVQWQMHNICMATATAVTLAASFELLTFDLDGEQTSSSSVWSQLTLFDHSCLKAIKAASFINVGDSRVKNGLKTTPAVDLNVHNEFS